MLYKKLQLPQKLLAIALSALLMLALFPATALADNEPYISDVAVISLSGGLLSVNVDYVNLPPGSHNVTVEILNYGDNTSTNIIATGSIPSGGVVTGIDVSTLTSGNDYRIKVTVAGITDSHDSTVFRYYFTCRIVSYDSNGGTGSMPSYLLPEGVTHTVQPNGFIPPAGHYFDSWNTMQNGVGVTYRVSESLTVRSDDIILYAQWLPIPPAVNSVTVSPDTANVHKGGTQQFTAIVDASGSASTDVTWSVDSQLSTIDQNGLLSVGQNETMGTLAVTATSTVDHNKFDTAEVTVITPVTGVTLNKPTLTLAVGVSETLTATVEPGGATNQVVTWLSDNTSVTTVTNGEVTAVAPGRANITVTTEDGGHTATCAVTVMEVVYPFTTNFGTYTGQEEGLTGVNDANISAFTGLEVNGELLHGSNYTTNAGSTIITLHPSYLDTLDNGTYTVRALFMEGYADGSFTVNRQGNAVSVTGVTLDKTTASITVGNTVQLTATVSPSNATSKGVTWASSDTSVATVDANGKVKGVKSGTATITVTTDDGGYTATCKVTATNAADSPQTGDSGNMMLWIITGLSSILISLYLLVWRKQQQLKENA